MEQIKRYFERDRLARLLGMELTDVAPGRATARMTVGEDHLNSIGTAHGGVVFSLADFVFAAASNAHGTVAVALNATISYMKAVPPGEVISASAEEVALGRKTGTYLITVTDAAGEKVALFQGMVYRKGDAIEWPA